MICFSNCIMKIVNIKSKYHIVKGCLKIISSIKKIFVYLRTSVKVISLIIISTLIIAGLVAFVYKPIYHVSLNGEFIGYCENKFELQDRIQEYIDHGDSENIAFVNVDELPEYKMCMLKKGIVPNDDEIFEKVKSTGTPYYKFYAITENDEEKIYVATFEEAETAVNSLKEKKSTNKDKLGILEKYETQMQTIVTSEEAISKLYIAPVVKKTVTVASTGSVDTSRNLNTTSQKISLGISFIQPVSGVITSRFGGRSLGTHSGLDIGVPTGTPIKAAAGGTVTFSGYQGTYGYLVVISHGNGVQTYYAHNSSLAVKAGQEVSQGQVISYSGSTGRSTGPHLHLEIRVNGVAQNPQNYIY